MYLPQIKYFLGFLYLIFSIQDKESL